MKINNARQLPKVYYGMHMEPGVAEYAEPNKEPYRILIVENALKTMDATYAGKPVYVEHVEEVDVENLQAEADGYVMESFFNQADGKHWAKFIVVSDRGHEAVRRGWKLSNSYVPQSQTEGGEWHGVSYAAEITAGEYEHLAIVPNPRYEASVIMTPEQFKQYNEDKKAELQRLSNSKQEKKTMGLKLNFFKRAKVDNAADLADTSVVLPKSGKEITISKLVEDHDEVLSKKKNSMADPGDKVKMHDGNMCNVSELVEKHKALHDELQGLKQMENEEMEESDEEIKPEDVDSESNPEMENDDPSDVEDPGAIEEDKQNDEDAEDDASMDNEEDDEEMDKKKNKEDGGADKELEMAKKKKNAADAALKALEAKRAGGKKANVADLKAAAEKKKNAKEKAERLRNAHLNVEPEEEARVELMGDQIARGKSLYGSN